MPSNVMVDFCNQECADKLRAALRMLFKSCGHFTYGRSCLTVMSALYGSTRLGKLV